MSIFPVTDTSEEFLDESSILPIPKEWAWDFTKNDFNLMNKKPYLVEGLDALKIWAFKALLTERYKHPFYSWNYGSEIISLIGSGFSRAAVESEVKRLVDETLLSNPYILGVKNLSISNDQDSLSVEFIIDTVYGETGVNTGAN